MLARRLTYSSVSYDESYFLWAGFSLSSGLAPYKEFFEYKPPVLFLTNAAALLLGLEHQRYRLLFTGLALVGVLSFQLALLSRRVNRGLALAAALLVTAFYLDRFYHDSSLDDAESIGLAYFLIGLGCLVCRTRFRRTADTMGGIFMACAVLSKEPFAFVVVFSWAAAIFFRDGSPRDRSEASRIERRRGALRYLGFTTLGVALVVLALCAYMVPAGAMKSYFALLDSYRTYSDPKTSVCVVLGRWVPGTFGSEWSLRWHYMTEAFLRGDTTRILLPYLGALGLLATRSRWRALVFVILGAAGALYAVTLTGCFWVHYYVIAMAGVALVAFAGTDAIDRSLRRAPLAIRVALPVVLLVWVGVDRWPRYDAEASAAVVAAPAPIDPAILDFIERSTTPTDRIWTTGNPALYVFAHRLSATRESAILDDYLPQTPGRTPEEKLAPVYKQLVANRPKIVVLDHAFDERKVQYLRVVVNPFLQTMGYRRAMPNVFVRPDS